MKVKYSTSDIVSLAAAWLSIMSVFVAHAVLGVQIWRGSWKVEDSLIPWYLILTNIFAVIIIIYLSATYVKKSKKAARLDSEAKNFGESISRLKDANSDIALYMSNISHERTGLTDQFVAIYTHSSLDTQELKHRCQRFTSIVLSNTREIFETFTAHPCAVCIKLFINHDPFPTSDTVPSPESNLLKTLLRDDVSNSARNSSGEDETPYEYNKNAAFWSIIDDPKAGDFYYSNDLNSLGDEYWNDNPHWPNHYNATAVVPIKKPGTRAKENAIGFLCIDNKKGGFDESFTNHTLNTIASTLYYVLSNTYLVIRYENQLRGRSE